ncbi:hypothetical protein ACFB49_31620 [Sphingomonas sp. DBB INV C78]|uniref:PEPxxWA-CTERM sorting domain-containing protein n=1 Tax=Sphingomonas sp. DBB INV C78 TaxID=3349434 RepID=UPI0036D399F4
MELKQLRRRLGLMMAAAVTILAWTSTAQAKILVDQKEPYGGYSVGGYDWTKFTAALGAQPDGYAIGDLGNAADVASADAILVVARSNFGSAPTLSATEITNLTNFLATGGRVALIGEGAFFFNLFSENIIDFSSGGTATVGGNVNTTANAIATHELTNGVTSVHIQGAGIVSGGSGLALFDQNFATLWGDNLLTVMDLNVLQDNPAPVFRDNIAAWLGASSPAPVPEPASWAMMIAGFGLIGATMRRYGQRNVTVRYA